MGWAKKQRKGKHQAKRSKRTRVPRGLGHMSCARKCALIYARNTNLSGIVAVNGATNGNFVWGVPEVLPYGTAWIANVPFTMTFCLNQVINPIEYQALFDRYKITGVGISIKHNSNTSDGGNLSPGMFNFNAVSPAINYVVDYDSNEMQTVSQMRQRMGLKRKTFGSKNNLVKIHLTPKLLTNVYNNAAVPVAYATASSSDWIDTDYLATTYYSLRGYFEDFNTVSTTYIDNVMTIDITLELAFKDMV